MTDYKIYCDMDGVLVDFNKGYFELTGHKLDGIHRTDTHFWDPINKAGYDFWINLEWIKPDGHILWEYIEKYNPKLLSAPSRQEDSRVAKLDWVYKELPDTKLILRSAKHKKDFASPTSILIDDRVDNISDWVGAGGIGILHKNAKDTILQLKDLNL
jgi:FMN phosphatase YigB (HAD superfamily)